MRPTASVSTKAEDLGGGLLTLKASDMPAESQEARGERRLLTLKASDMPAESQEAHGERRLLTLKASDMPAQGSAGNAGNALGHESTPSLLPENSEMCQTASV